jgi:hypothetical protein
MNKRKRKRKQEANEQPASDLANTKQMNKRQRKKKQEENKQPVASEQGALILQV